MMLCYQYMEHTHTHKKKKKQLGLVAEYEKLMMLWVSTQDENRKQKLQSDQWDGRCQQGSFLLGRGRILLHFVSSMPDLR